MVPSVCYHFISQNAVSVVVVVGDEPVEALDLVVAQLVLIPVAVGLAVPGLLLHIEHGTGQSLLIHGRNNNNYIGLKF